MQRSADEFSSLVGAVLRRYFAQNARPVPSDADVAGFSARLWALVEERGLPRPLARNERGAPGEMAESECLPLLARVLAELTDPDPVLADAARQLVKACFYPEFKTCRDSYREVSPDGSRRRQEPARARKRVSGSHCVDCPYWVALTPERHRRFLARQWGAGSAAFETHRDLFLPEDFRALRRWLHAAARDLRPSTG